MILRRAFLRRMAFAAAASAFIDLPTAGAEEGRGVLGVTGSTYEQWRPFRLPSETIDSIEVVEYMKTVHYVLPQDQLVVPTSWLQPR